MGQRKPCRLWVKEAERWDLDDWSEEVGGEVRSVERTLELSPFDCAYCRST